MSKYSNEWGKEAEQIATDYIIQLGMPVMQRNWSPKKGHKEIDIISQSGKAIVFIEVKARNGKHDDPIDALTPQKISNLCTCAESYLATLPEDFWEYRFDIITITGNKSEYKLEHIEDAFLAPLKSYRKS